ncbi:MAG: N-6 DNA methylase [Deltaproteobacteria bacterium]
MSKLRDKKIKILSPFDASVHKTERTANQKLVEWMNQIIKEKNFPLGLAEQETSGADRKQPDIVIFESPRSDNVLCVIELKPPYFDPIDYEELKKPAWEKANRRKAKYYCTSNFQWLIWFNTEKTNRMESEDRQVVDKFNLSQIEDLDSIEEGRYKNAILKGLEMFLYELSEVHTGIRPEPLHPIDEYLIFRLQEKIHRLAKHYRNIIRDTAHKDTKFFGQLAKWFNEQQWDFTGSDTDYDKAARQTAYLLVNKIFFYDVLQSKRPHQLDPLNIPDDLTRGGLLQTMLQGYFNDVLKNIDYETIYTTDFVDQIAFPDSKEVVSEIKDLIKLLKGYDFSKIGFDVIGKIFEGLIPREERHNLGQYFTNADVVDIILRFCMRHETDKVFDPSCGAGTFLVRAYQHKKMMNDRLTHPQILESLWGVDIAKFPAHLSTINLAVNGLEFDKNYPNISQEDFFNLMVHREGLELPEKWRKVRAKTLGVEERDITYPRWYDCIVGNPPYTRQEEMADMTGKEGYKDKLIKNALYYEKQKLADISKRAGIHAYFFVHGTKFLKDGGRFGFIVSNSWMDVNYGKGLQELFLKNYKIFAIIESKIERWFEDADVNTSIIILEKCSNEKERNGNFVRFVNLFKPLRHFIPPAQDMWEKQKQRLDAIDNLRKTILSHNEFYQNDELRIYPKKQSELWEEGFDTEENKYTGSKWGKYLRAPEIFFKILEKGKDKLVPLKEIANIRRGFTTGANEFFYLTEDEIVRLGIEKEFWMHKDEKGNWVPNKVTVSPREAKSVVIKPDNLSKNILFINKDKEKLKNKKVLSYIKQGERRGFHEGGTCSSRNRWYELEYREPWAIFYPRVHTDRQLVISNKYMFQADCSFMEIKPKRKRDVLPLLCFLLSTVSMLFKEFFSRTYGGGTGPIDIKGTDFEKTPVIKYFSKEGRLKLKKLAIKYPSPEIKSIFKDLQADTPEDVTLDKVNPARRELDKIIMGDILGLTDDEQLEVYRAVVDLVKSRIEKAKSIDKKGKTKEGIDVELLTKTIKEKLGDKLLGHFYKEKILIQKDLKTVRLFHPANEVRIEHGLFGWRLSSGKDHIDCESEEEARYLKIWIEAGLDEVKIPEDKKYLKAVLTGLEALKEKIDQTIYEHVSSIVNQKLRGKIMQKLQGELFK